MWSGLGGEVCGLDCGAEGCGFESREGGLAVLAGQCPSDQREEGRGFLCHAPFLTLGHRPTAQLPIPGKPPTAASAMASSEAMHWKGGK